MRSALGVPTVRSGNDGGVSLPPYASLNLAGHVGDDPAFGDRRMGAKAR